MQLKGKIILVGVAAGVLVIGAFVASSGDSSSPTANSGQSSSAALPAPNPGDGVGQWTSSDINTFETKSGFGDCVTNDLDTFMNSGDAIAVATTIPNLASSWNSSSIASTLESPSKYGSTEGTVLYVEYTGAMADASVYCNLPGA